MAGLLRGSVFYGPRSSLFPLSHYTWTRPFIAARLVFIAARTSSGHIDIAGGEVHERNIKHFMLLLDTDLVQYLFLYLDHYLRDRPALIDQDPLTTPTFLPSLVMTSLDSRWPQYTRPAMPGSCFSIFLYLTYLWHLNPH